MKCPKCGFNSFEFLDNCKKCGSEVATFKKNMGILPIVFQSNEISFAGVKQIVVSDPSGDSASAAAEDTTDETFSWEAPSAGDTIPGDRPFDGFDLDLIKPDETATPDFPSENETSAANTAESLEGNAIDFGGFSFDETVDPVSESAENQLFTGHEEQLLDLEDMDLSSATDTGSFGESGVHGEFLPGQLINYDRETTTGEKAGQPVPSNEQSGQVLDLDELINENVEKPDETESRAKKYSTDTLDFDKEFEAIFNDEKADAKEQKE